MWPTKAYVQRSGCREGPNWTKGNWASWCRLGRNRPVAEDISAKNDDYEFDVSIVLYERLFGLRYTHLGLNEAAPLWTHPSCKDRLYT
jgi:hypothetical protein